MYDELVKRLREADISHPPVYLFGRAADAIEELQEDNAALNGTVSNLIQQIEELNKPRWIPVTERLPEIDMSYPHHENYLVQYDSGNMDVASWSNVNRFWTDHVTEPHWNCVQFAEVIAWMPLPKPWKEE